MRKLLIIALLGTALTAFAQQKDGQPKFDPERYQAVLEQFITSEACLTPTEAAKFFPVYREMMKKQHSVFHQLRKYRHIKPADEQGCREAILLKDEVDIQAKELQQQYHQKFLRILTASKLYDVIKAEEKFHRQSFKRMSERKKQKSGK